VNSSDETVRAILASTRTIAIVGFSHKPDRPSHRVARFLQQKGYRIVPVNPGLAGRTLLDEEVFANLGEIPVARGPIDMVDIFRRSEDVGPVVDDALAHLMDRGLRTIWMQLGVIAPDAASRAEAAGLSVVMDRCPAIELPRLMPA
jgi:predicted CoA-binding protein